MRSFSTKSIVEGALLLGILVILGLLSNLVPIVGAVTFAFLPIPIIFAIIKHGFKVALMMGFLSVVILIIVGINPIAASVDSVYATFTGMALGYGILKKLKAVTTFMITSASIMLAGIVIFLIIGAFLQVDVIGEAINMQFIMMENIIDMVTENPDRYPFFERALNLQERIDLEEFTSQLRIHISLLLPAILVVVGCFYGYLNYILARLVLSKFKIAMEPFPAFREWRFSSWIIWIFIIAFGLEVFILPRIFGAMVPLSVRTIVYSANQISLIAIIIQGLAVAFKFFAKIIPSNFMRIILLSLLFMLVPQMIVLVGMVDFYWDLRRF